MIIRSPHFTRRRALNLRVGGGNVENRGVQAEQADQGPQQNPDQQDQVNALNAPVPPAPPQEMATDDENEHFREQEESMAEEDVLNRLLNVSIEPNQAPAQNGNEDERRRVVEGLQRENFLNWLDRERERGRGVYDARAADDYYRAVNENWVPNARRNDVFLPRTSTPTQLHEQFRNIPGPHEQNVRRERHQSYEGDPEMVGEGEDRYRQANEMPEQHQHFVPVRRQMYENVHPPAQQYGHARVAQGPVLNEQRQARQPVFQHQVNNLDYRFRQGRNGERDEGMGQPYPPHRAPHRFSPPEQRNVAAPFDDQINQGQAQQFRRGNAYPRSTEWAQPQQNTGVISSLEYNMVLERIPDLSGKEGSDEVKRFFKKFGAYTEDWPDQKRIKALESKVFGRAERTFETAKMMAPNSYAFICKEMIAQLEETDSKNLNAFDELMTGVRRKPNETIDDLACRISSLVKRAYPGLQNCTADEFSIKFLIRAMGDPALSLNLELARTSGMPLDHFVSLAARAESTQRAVQRFSDERRNAVESRAPAFFQENRRFNGGRDRPTEYIRKSFEPVRTNTQQLQDRSQWKCYNCNEVGHFSRNCPKSRQFETNTQSMRAPNRNFFATGANRTQPEAPNRDANMAKPSSSNFLKHNCIVTQQEKVHPDVCLSKIELMPEMNDFYENVVTSIENCSEKTLPAIGKVMAVKMEAYGVEADAMLDGGAQISLINANFLYQLVKEKRTNLAALEPSKVCARVLDVNGKLLTCLFAVKLKLFRRGLESPADIIAQVTKAPIGFDLLIGTNGLGKLGFKLYDEINDEMVPFETAKEKDKNFLTVIYRTTIEPRSTRTLEFEVGEGYENSEILATSEIAESVRVEPTVGIVREGKIVASITNLSLSAITLEERQQIGQIEPVQEIGESEDLLANPIISMVATQQTTEREAQVNVEANNWWSKQTGGLSEKEIEELQILTEQFFDILAVRDEELTQTNLVKHQIETGDAAPIKLRMRPVPFAYRQKVAGMIQDYLGRGVIQPSFSPWASPIVIVPKRDGTLRFCVDYRAVNSVTRKDSFPLPNIDNTLLMLGGKKFFSTLDFMTGYWQIKMEKNAVEKTAFTTEHGLYEFIVMPFGLTNAVATFQRFMTRLFEGVVNKFVFIYIDDILIASESFGDHIKHLGIVFSRIREAGLKLKMSKCHLCANELPFLGHILTREGIKMDADKVKPVTSLPTPKNKKELHSLLGFLTYYRKFIHSFGTIAAPLFKLLSDKVEFKIGEKEKEIIEELKGKILQEVVLYFPDFEAAQNDPDRRFIMMTDASKTGIAAILSQPDAEKRIRPIYFASRQCNSHESRYSATELEALAVRFGAKKFAQFITMIPTRVITDHKALIWMFRSKNETGNARVDRWLLELNSRFILKVEHQPGKNNVIADVLSRSESLRKEISEPQDEEEIAFVGKIGSSEDEPNNRETMQNRKEWIEQTKIGEMKPVYDFLQQKIMSDDPKERQSILDKCHRYTILEGLLYLSESDGKLKLFVPQMFRSDLIKNRHEGICAGHMSGKKLFKQLSAEYFWPNMLADCILCHQSCRICAHTRTPRANEPPLKVVQSSEPLELVCMDVLDVGPSHSNQKYICVIVDHFTKYVVAEPIPNKSADAVAKIFVERFTLVFGAPVKIHSDRGKEFLNATMEEIGKILGIKRSFTAGYDPQCNGLAERINRILIGILKKSTSSNWTWDERLAYAVFSYNITPTRTTGFAPFTLMFGRHARFPLDEVRPLPVNPAYTIDSGKYIQLFRENLLTMLDEARENSEEARRQNKLWYDKQPRVTPNKFREGDRVMVVFPGLHRRAHHKKLLWSHFGPYVILELGDSSAKLVPIDKKGDEPIKVPIERLVRVPKGVPDISTLPKGKNPFKNELKLLALYAGIHSESREFVQNGEIKMEKAEQLQLGTIAFDCLGEKWEKSLIISEPMETEEKVTAGFGWTSTCSGGGPGHELCEAITLGSLDPVLSLTKLGPAVTKTPLQALLSTFLLRSGVASSLTAAQTLVGVIVGAEAKLEFCMYFGKRGDQISTGKYPTEEDQQRTLEQWVGACYTARQALAATGYRPLRMEIPEGVEALTGPEKKKWEEVFEQSSWALERVRSVVVHKAGRFLAHTRVLLGDSSARLMSQYITNSYCIGEEGSMADIIRQFQPTVLSSRVQALLILAGRDSLMAGETADSIAAQFEMVVELCRRFPHVRIYWCPPPYVHAKATEHEALVAKMQDAVLKGPILPVYTTEKGRSVLEIFRFGDNFNKFLVSSEGVMHNSGCKMLKAWIYTQTTFPGDKDLQVRALRSAVTVPVGNRADTGTAPKVAPRDRADPSRAGPSRSRVRPDQSSFARHHPYAGHWCSSDGRDVSVRRADRSHPSRR